MNQNLYVGYSDRCHLEAATKLKNQSKPEFSDDLQGREILDQKHTKVTECKNGKHLLMGIGESGTQKFRSTTEYKKAQIGATDSDPCDCKICTTRNENETSAEPLIGLRSGKKRGWEKYGPGRTL